MNRRQIHERKKKEKNYTLGFKESIETENVEGQQKLIAMEQ